MTAFSFWGALARSEKACRKTGVGLPVRMNSGPSDDLRCSPASTDQIENLCDPDSLLRDDIRH